VIEIVAAVGVVIGFIYALTQKKSLREAVIYAFAGGITLPIVYMVAKLAVTVIVLLMKILLLIAILALLYTFLRGFLRGVREGYSRAKRP